MPIESSQLDQLQAAYKDAVDHWIAAVREEESLATPDHSLPAWERWDQAGFKAQGAYDHVVSAKEAYKDGLRQKDYSIQRTGKARVPLSQLLSELMDPLSNVLSLLKPRS